MASKMKKTRVRTQYKKKQAKRTRRTAKGNKESKSYLATMNDEFVMVDKPEPEAAPAAPAAASGKHEDDPSKIAVGKIYANWCIHCKNMSEPWETLKGKLDENKYIFLETEEADVPTRIDEINQIYLKDSSNKLVANGYPTVYRIEKGKIQYYEGERTVDAMYDWFVTQKGGKHKVEKQAKESKGWFSWW